MGRLFGFSVLLGLAACSVSPSPSTQAMRDLQTNLAADTRAMQQARVQQEAAARQAAGIVSPEEQRTADGVQVVLTTGHVTGIAQVGVSADGRYVVSGDSTQIKVWEIASHSEVRSFAANAMPGMPGMPGAPGMQAAFRVTSGGCRLLLGRSALLEETSLHDCVTGRQLASASLISDDGNVTVSDAGTRLREGQTFMGSGDTGLKVFDVATGRQSVLPAPAGSASLAISANGQTVLTNVFDVNNSGWRSTISGALGIAGTVASIVVPGVGSIAGLVSDAATDAVGTSPQESTMDIVAWNVPTRRKLLKVRTSQLSNLAALSADGSSLYVENKDRSIDGYDLAGGQKRRIAPADGTMTGPAFIHDKLVLSATGNALARQVQDDSVEIFDTRTAQKLGAFAADPDTGAPDSLRNLATGSAILPVFSPDGRLVAVSSATQRIHVWEVGTGRSVMQTQAAAIAFNPDGRTVILGRSNESAPILHDLTTAKEETFGVHLDSVAEVGVTADGRLAVATSLQPGGVRLWDLATGQLSGNLRTCPGGSVLLSARPSPTAAMVAAKCADGSIALWDELSGQWTEQLSAATPEAPSVRVFKSSLPPGTHAYGVGDDVQFSADGRLLAVAADEQVTVWNLDTKTRISRISTHDRPISPPTDPTAALIQEAAINNASIDPQTLKSLPQSERDLMQAVANEQKSSAARVQKQLSDPLYLEMMNVVQRQITHIAIDGSTHRIALIRAGEVSLWDLQTGQLVRPLNTPQGYAATRLPGGLRFDPDGRTLYGPNGLKWDVSSENPEAIAPSQPEAPLPTDRWARLQMLTARMAAGMRACCNTTSTLSPDGKVLARGVGNVVRLTDVVSGRDLGDLVGHTQRVTSAAFAPDGRTLLSGSEDGSVRVWNVADRKEVVSLYALGVTDYVAVRPDQFYRASKARLAGISFRVQDQLYPFEQFDLRFNRPDLVAEGLGRATPDEIQQYRKAREHRLKKMGFTEAMLSGTFHLPEAHVVGEVPPARIEVSSLALRIRAEDSQYPLDRINVFVNDVPIFGTSGLPVVDRQARSDEQQVVVPLVPGANKIQVSTLNQQGVESFKQTFYTLNSAISPPGDIYIVAIGVSRYQNPRYNLKFAAKDASDLMNLYSSARGVAHGQVHLLDLTNERATRAQIHQARQWLAQAHPNDLAIVFAAGHGVTDDHHDYYFGTYDIDALHPEINGLAYEEFETLLDGIPPLKKMLLLDTCFSGEIDKEETSVITDVATGVNGTVKMRSFRAARGVSLTADPVQNGAASSTAASPISAVGSGHFEDLFADLRRGTGAVVISSASGNEYALEGERWNNGVFTYAVLSGLKEGSADANKDGVVTVGELQAYVIEEVRKLTAGGQNPTVRQENLDFDFQIY